MLRACHAFSAPRHPRNHASEPHVAEWAPLVAVTAVGQMASTARAGWSGEARCRRVQGDNGGREFVPRGEAECDAPLGADVGISRPRALSDHYADSQSLATVRPSDVHLRWAVL